jgi:predicted transcriptional regulator of viral defense system
MRNVYETLLKSDKRYLTGREVSRLLNISPVSRKVSLSRLANRNILRRLRRDLYEVVLKPTEIIEAANSVYQPSYLSFSFCLGKLGILNQIPYEIEFATTKKTKKIEIRTRSVVFRKLKPELFFGYTLKDNVFIAKPEKALLDTLYMQAKGLESINENELNMGNIDKKEFLSMAKKYPVKVQKEAAKLVQ